jgi:hypothetical protein
VQEVEDKLDLAEKIFKGEKEV